jgi:hypothetical protein
VQPAHPRVRPLPYPFHAGLAISNDAEFHEIEFFESLMKFANTDRQTLLGQGLGIELSASGFFYSAHPYSFSYFSGPQVEALPGVEAPRMNDYLQSRWMDTLHAYGDFDFVGGFTRQHAVRSFEILDQLGVRLEIFTDHGTLHNVQNIGPGADYHQGDRRDSPAYHADLMKSHGIRYIWSDVDMVTEPSPGYAREVIARVAMNTNGASSPGRPLLAPHTLQDGSCFLGIQRLRGTGPNAPNLSSLGYQMGLIDWGRFYEEHGIVVLYQHLGVSVREAGRCRRATIEEVKARPEVYLAPFYFLAREKHEGRLWVASLLRLLRYMDMMASLSVTVTENAFALDCARLIENPEEHFQGLTVYIDSNHPTTVRHRGKDLPLVMNGPDETGCYSAMVPLRMLPDIW